MIGVLAIQGDFAAHGRMLDKLSARWCEIKNPHQLEYIKGLILPGGESTTMLKFLTDEGFINPLKEFAERGCAIFGTCAGAILLAREVSNPAQESLSLIDISIERNGYGRQLNSFIDFVDSESVGLSRLEAVFIRAPVINRVGDDVEILASYSSHPILIRQGKLLAATFHPELTNDLRVHQNFLSLVES